MQVSLKNVCEETLFAVQVHEERLILFFKFKKSDVVKLENEHHSAAHW